MKGSRDFDVNLPIQGQRIAQGGSCCGLRWVLQQVSSALRVRVGYLLPSRSSPLPLEKTK